MDESPDQLEAKPPARPVWVKVFIAALAVALVIVVVAALGGGEHGPARHLPGSDRGGHSGPAEHGP